MNNKMLFKLMSTVTIAGTIIATVIILPTVQQKSNRIVRNELLLTHREPSTYNTAHENNLILYSNYQEGDLDGINVKGYVKEDMQLMSNPLKGSTVIGNIKKGSTINVLARIASWYKVEYNGNVGYIFSRNTEYKNPVDI